VLKSVKGVTIDVANALAIECLKSEKIVFDYSSTGRIGFMNNFSFENNP